ncbi:MAG: LacI family DNA-binding transcriptional regulator [Lachnospiraceae bacterium]|nr:LacI family DNA-binding transcriptional regulator [Lachnospiraceae bacterium]
MITLKEIADKMNVSPTTVANVLHGRNTKVSKENIERIQKALKEYNYVQKMGLEALAKGKTRIIAVVIHTCKLYDNTTVGDPFYSLTIGTLEEKIRNTGYFMMLYINTDLDSIFQMASSWNVAGIITVTFSQKNFLKLKALVECPLVGIDTYNEDSHPLECEGCHVTLDDIDAGYQVGEYLIEEHFENILVLSDDKYGSSALRAIGLKKSMKKHGLPLSQYWNIILNPQRRNRTSQLDSLLHLAGRHYAIFCTSDQLAMEVISHLSEHGHRIPDEYSIMGFDDNPIARYAVPKLTTMRQDIVLKSEKAAAILLQLINGENVPDQIVLLPVSLVVRNSVAYH